MKYVFASVTSKFTISEYITNYEEVLFIKPIIKIFSPYITGNFSGFSSAPKIEIAVLVKDVIF